METMDPESLLFLLGMRASNALRGAGIKTLEDLVAADPEIFPGKIKNLGATNLLRINTLLVSRGFEPKGRRRNQNPSVTGLMRDMVSRIAEENPLEEGDETPSYWQARLWRRLLSNLGMGTEL